MESELADLGRKASCRNQVSRRFGVPGVCLVRVPGDEGGWDDESAVM